MKKKIEHLVKNEQVKKYNITIIKWELNGCILYIFIVRLSREKK